MLLKIVLKVINSAATEQYCKLIVGMTWPCNGTEDGRRS